MSAIASVEDFDQCCCGNLIPLLRDVPVDVVAQFRAGLRFGPSGIAHADYSMLEGHVADEALPELFGHFGISKEKFDAIEDTSCVGGTCFHRPRAFCNPDQCRHI